MVCGGWTSKPWGVVRAHGIPSTFGNGLKNTEARSLERVPLAASHPSRDGSSPASGTLERLAVRTKRQGCVEVHPPLVTVSVFGGWAGASAPGHTCQLAAGTSLAAAPPAHAVCSCHGLCLWRPREEVDLGRRPAGSLGRHSVKGRLSSHHAAPPNLHWAAASLVGACSQGSCSPGLKL